MKRYFIKEAFYLKSAGILMGIGSYYPTDDEAEQKELEGFIEDGSCELIESMKESNLKLKSNKQTPKTPEKPDDDVTVVPGVGKSVEEKLNELGIATLTQLKESLTKRAEEVKEAVGAMAFAKIEKYFQEQ